MFFPLNVYNRTLPIICIEKRYLSVSMLLQNIGCSKSSFETLTHPGSMLCSEYRLLNLDVMLNMNKRIVLNEFIFYVKRKTEDTKTNKNKMKEAIAKEQQPK